VPRKLAIPLFIVFIALFFVPGEMWAQEAPKELAICDLANNPKSFDGKMIRVRGTLSVYFEDFSLVGGQCDTQQGIWLTFGGDVPGIVASTVNDSSRKPGVDVKVNGVSYGIKKDKNFLRLYALIAARHGDKPAFQVTATLTGVFFAGKERKLPNGHSDFAGYGHLGCCALLVITEVSDVESVPPANLHVRGTVVGPDGRQVKGFVVFDDILGGSPSERQQTITDEKGNFEFSNSGQLLRFENSSYRPLALPVKPGGAQVRVKLEDAKRSDWITPSCGEMKDIASRIGFSALFTLPSIMESDLSNDDDSRSYFVFPHGGGSADAELIISTSTDETAEQSDSVDSKWSEQRWVKDSAGAVVGTDAWGRSKHGERWRKTIFWRRDFVGYDQHGLHTRTPISVLDAIINSACITER
jgi:hypothetical protein